ncbi:Telomerase Cajal body protein 1 [Coemansia interrupta]|uniref:Telomerase Cajal body protein 1 n=1 Tax=Coemansia interrupta TaxID=1126814 RepID=A0A9W8HC07_9FUNG|nr:Telomerase Cajal body protein 1 [Coemansia interrupta]
MSVSQYYAYNADGDSCCPQMDCIAQATQTHCVRLLQWSPDGEFLSSITDANELQIHNTSDISLHHNISHPSTLNGYAWYPYMDSADPATCCLATCVRDQPLHLRDSNTGMVRASYLAHAPHGQLLTPGAVAFGGYATLFAGYSGWAAHFDVHRQGAPAGMEKIPGIVSCVVPGAETLGLTAWTTFAGHISLRANDLEEALLWRVPEEFGGPQGIMHCAWAPDAQTLWTATRGAQRHLVAWDIRNVRQPLLAISKPAVRAGQLRTQFAFDQAGRYLVVGSADRPGCVDVHDLAEEGKRVGGVGAHGDVVVGMAAHPVRPLLATASGQRHFDQEEVEQDYSLKIWSVAASFHPYAEINCE